MQLSVVSYRGTAIKTGMQLVRHGQYIQNYLRPRNSPASFDLNYPEIPDSCLLLQFSTTQNIL